jgi:phage-related protein
MPASSQNIVELILTMKDAQEILDQFKGVERAAAEVVLAVKNGVANMASMTTTATRVVADKLQQFTLNLFDRTGQATRDLGAWFVSALNLVREQYPILDTALQTYIVKPVTSLYDTVTKTLHKIVGKTLGYYEEGTTFIEKISNVARGAANALYDTTLGKISQATDYLAKEYPKTAKLLEGSWLVAKTAVLAFSTAMVGVPAIAIKAGQAIYGIGAMAVNGLGKAWNAVKVGVKIFSDIKSSIIGSKNHLGEYEGGILGISKALNLAKKAAKISIEIVGVVGALGLLKAFFMQAGGIFASSGSAWDIIMDRVNAALLPVASQMIRLAEKVAPMIVRAMMPLVDMMLKLFTFANKALDETVTGTGKFGGILGTIKDTVKAIAESGFGMLISLSRTLLPIIIEISKFTGEVLKDIVVQVLPMVKELAATLFPAITSVFRQLMPIVKDLVKALVESLAPIIVELSGSIIRIIQDLVKLLPALLPALKDLAKSLAELLVAVAPMLVGILKALTEITAKLLLPAVVKLLVWFTQILVQIIDLLTGVISIIVELGGIAKGTFYAVIDDISGFFYGLANVVDKVFGGIFTFLKESWTELKEFFGFDTLAEGIAGVFGSIASSLETPFKVMKEYINAFIVEPIRWFLTTELPVIGSLADLWGDPIPKPMAVGGIVSKPMVSLLGEAGPEAVIPLTPEGISKIAPAIIPQAPPVIVRPVIVPTTPANVEFPDRMTTAHGPAIVDVLGRIERVLMTIERKIQYSPEEEQKDMPIAFTLEGFSA